MFPEAYTSGELLRLIEMDAMQLLIPWDSMVPPSASFEMTSHSHFPYLCRWSIGHYENWLQFYYSTPSWLLTPLINGVFLSYILLSPVFPAHSHHSHHLTQSNLPLWGLGAKYKNVHHGTRVVQQCSLPHLQRWSASCCLSLQARWYIQNGTKGCSSFASLLVISKIYFTVKSVNP